jgi:hypothetical protein
VIRRMTSLIVLAILAAFCTQAADGAPRKKRYRPPSRKKILKKLETAEKGIYYLSREGAKDVSVVFKKFTKVGWITRKMYWRAPGKFLYRIEDLPPEYQKRQQAFVGRMIAEFDGTMYPLVCKPWVKYAEDFELSIPDPEKPKSILFTPKEGVSVRFLRKILELGPRGLPMRVTTFLSPPPPTAEELKIDPDFKGREIETYTDLSYIKIGRKLFFRRVDIEAKGKKVIVDIEKWEGRGGFYLPTELTLVDPFAGNEVLEGKDIKVDQGLKAEMFEGSAHRLER